MKSRLLAALKIILMAWGGFSLIAILAIVGWLLAPYGSSPRAVGPEQDVRFAGSSIEAGEIPWFPKEAELRSKNMYVYPWSIYTHGVQPTAVKLIFARPTDRMIFYFDEKM